MCAIELATLRNQRIFWDSKLDKESLSLFYTPEAMISLNPSYVSFFFVEPQQNMKEKKRASEKVQLRGKKCSIPFKINFLLFFPPLNLKKKLIFYLFY